MIRARYSYTPISKPQLDLETFCNMGEGGGVLTVITSFAKTGSNFITYFGFQDGVPPQLHGVGVPTVCFMLSYTYTHTLYTLTN